MFLIYSPVIENLSFFKFLWTELLFKLMIHKIDFEKEDANFYLQTFNC